MAARFRDPGETGPMAPIRTKQQLVPSVLDRLLEYDPEVSRELAKQRNQVLRELKDSVRRDLNNLLNTRIRCLSLPLGLEELKRSLVNYGTPDLTGATLGSSKERDEFCRTLERIINQHE